MISGMPWVTAMAVKKIPFSAANRPTSCTLNCCAAVDEDRTSAIVCTRATGSRGSTAQTASRMAGVSDSALPDVRTIQSRSAEP